MAPGIRLDDKDMWDDSALIDSWDEAVAEYKKYYSIQASGKRLEDVLSKEELRELREEHGDLIEEPETSIEVNSHADGTEAGQAAEKAGGSAVNSTIKHQEQESAASGLARPAAAEQSQPEFPVASMPQALLTTVPDENLKNLMMSWYYAGYYTGLYSGSQDPAKENARKDQ